MILNFRLLLCVVAIVVSPLASSFAAPPTLQWDANPVSDEIREYRVYQVVGDTRSLVGVVASTSLPLPFPLPAGRLEYVVTAVNARGESLASNPAVIPASLPGKPATPRIVSGAGG